MSELEPIKLRRRLKDGTYLIAVFAKLKSGSSWV